MEEGFGDPVHEADLERVRDPGEAFGAKGTPEEEEVSGHGKVL
jgi:hypothetical protein